MVARETKNKKRRIVTVGLVGLVCVGMTLAAFTQTNSFSAFLRYDTSQKEPEFTVFADGQVLPDGEVVNLFNAQQSKNEEDLNKTADNTLQFAGTS